MSSVKANTSKPEKVAWKGACSQTFFHLLDREFGSVNRNGERAADPLAGGIKQTGHQCGMLWGAALAAGAESFRRQKDRGKAVGMAIMAAARLVDSFSKTAGSVNCRDLTGYDLTRKRDLLKFMVKFFLFLDRRCFRLADAWAPEAIRSAFEGLSGELPDFPRAPVSCASVVAQKMGAGDEEMVTVAGFAGGLGLSGNACGALSAAVWMKSLAWCRSHPGKSGYSNPDATHALEAFRRAAGSEFLCRNISGRCFRTAGEHTEFIEGGGCADLIDALARS